MRARTIAVALAAMAASFGWVQSARAVPITYTFEAPSFGLGQTTPLLDRAPNSGDASFRSDFTSGATPPLIISNFPPNSLFQGWNILSQPGAARVLAMSFSSAVNSISFDFGVEVPGSSMRVTAAGGVFDFLAQNMIGDLFQGGSVHLDFANPVTTLTLGVVTSTGVASGFAVDNVVLANNVVPEPATLALIGLGLAGLAVGRRKGP